MSAMAAQPEDAKSNQNKKDVSQEEQQAEQAPKKNQAKSPSISESFNPSEKISEDLAVPFPVDI